jgi:hypothetical protein
VSPDEAQRLLAALPDEHEPFPLADGCRVGVRTRPTRSSSLSALETAHDPHGSLESAALDVDLVDVDGNLVAIAADQVPPIPKEQVLSAVKAQVERTLDLTGLGSGGRIEDIALRKPAAADGVPAAFGLYTSGSRPARTPIGSWLCEVTSCRHRTRCSREPTSSSPPGPTFTATSARTPFTAAPSRTAGAASRTRFRRRPSDPTSEKIGLLKGIKMAPSEGLLRIKVDREYEIDNFDPDFKLIIDLFLEDDDEGVLTRGSGMTLEGGVFVHLVLVSSPWL